MTLDGYAICAETITSAAIAGDRDRYLSYLGLALAGEAGEVVDHIKKPLRDRTWNPDAVAEELGDVMYRWIRLVTATGHTPAEILAASAAKITAKAAAANPRR